MYNIRFLKFDDWLFCKKFAVIIAHGNSRKNSSEPSFKGAIKTTTLATINWLINIFHDILKLLLTNTIFGLTTTKDHIVIVISNVIGIKNCIWLCVQHGAIYV